jgi:hypothetical protein
MPNQTSLGYRTPEVEGERIIRSNARIVISTEERKMIGMKSLFQCHFDHHESHIKGPALDMRHCCEKPSATPKAR